MADKDLRIRITGDSTSAEAALKRLHGQSEQTTQSSSTLASSFAKVGTAFLAATAVIGGLVGAFELVKSGFESIIGFGKESIDTVTELGSETLYLERVFGMSAESASGLIAVFERFGIGTDQASKAMGIFEKNMESATEAGTSQAAMFAKLKITVGDVNGNLRPMDQILMQVADAFKSGLIPATERATVAKQLFGRAGLAMIPTLLQGRDGIAALTEQARKMGVVLGQDDVDAVLKLNIAKANLRQAINGLKDQIGLQLIPYVQKAIAAFNDWVAAHGGMQAVVIKYVIPALKAMGNAFADTLRWVGQMAGTIKNLIPVFEALGIAMVLVSPMPIKWKVEMVKNLKEGSDEAKKRLPEVETAFNKMANNVQDITNNVPPQVRAKGQAAVDQYIAEMSKAPGGVGPALAPLGPAVSTNFDKSLQAAEAGRRTRQSYIDALSGSLKINAQIFPNQGPPILESFNAVIGVGQQNRALGGMINYLAGGGMGLFQPMGTDTVPAMLTPGEFVVRKEAVDKLGTDTMQQINQGKVPSENGVTIENFNVKLEVPPMTPLQERRSAERLLIQMGHIVRAQGDRIFNKTGVFVQT